MPLHGQRLLILKTHTALVARSAVFGLPSVYYSRKIFTIVRQNRIFVKFCGAFVQSPLNLWTFDILCFGSQYSYIFYKLFLYLLCKSFGSVSFLLPAVHSVQAARAPTQSGVCRRACPVLGAYASCNFRLFCARCLTESALRNMIVLQFNVGELVQQAERKYANFDP